jgi:hypothetical protein
MRTAALSVASRAYVFQTGRVVAENSAAHILGDPDLLPCLSRRLRLAPELVDVIIDQRQL